MKPRLNFFKAVFPRPGSPELELTLQHRLRSHPGPAQPPPSFPKLPTDYLTCTNWGLLSTRRGRAMEKSLLGNETISSLHSSCRNKSGPPWHLSPPVPPAGLLATCTASREAGPGCLPLPCPLPLLGGVWRRLEERGRNGSLAAGRVIDDSARVPLNFSSKFSYRVGRRILKAAR